MRKNKKSIILLFIIAISSGQSVNASGSNDCNDRKIKAMDRMAQNAYRVFDGTITNPESKLSAIDACLKAISGLKMPVFRGSFSFPSVDSILKAVCGKAVSMVNEQTSRYIGNQVSGLSKNFNLNQFGIPGANDESWSYNSSDLYNGDLGGLSNPIVPDSNYSMPPVNNSSSNSNSSYLNNAVNSALKYLSK